jgi:exopolysaccharide biosynthesis protein
MKDLGAYNAMNLDGGASTSLYANGKFLATPTRKISNALMVLPR